MTRHPFVLILAASAAAIIAATCAGDTGTPTATADLTLADNHGAHAKSLTGALTVAQKQGIAAGRNATACFHNFEAAQHAGYTIQFAVGCAVDPGTGPNDPSQGAQAYHYMNETLLGDGVIDLERPELLMYEPQKNGSVKLVGVDYVLPRMFAKPAALLGMERSQKKTDGAVV